jgi:YfiH family protein
MIKRTKGKISFYQSDIFTNYYEVFHFFSTRNSGVSKGVFESLNFGTHHGEHENMKTNLSLLTDAFELNAEKFVIPKQTHSDVIGIVDESNYTDAFENTDALITNIPSIILAIKTADCVPILLFDPEKKVIGAVHSGWRGTAQNIVGKTIAEMNSVYGSNPSNILAAIGPCISQMNYEVGYEVIEIIKQVTTNQEGLFTYNEVANEKAFLDLSMANFQFLMQAGLSENNIDISRMCTFQFKEDFFSARRDGNITGRMINCISISK